MVNTLVVTGGAYCWRALCSFSLAVNTWLLPVALRYITSSNNQFIHFLTSTALHYSLRERVAKGSFDDDLGRLHGPLQTLCPQLRVHFHQVHAAQTACRSHYLCNVATLS